MSRADLRRGGPVPLYFQLQELLKEQLEAAAWAPGDLLPSEPQLCARFGVSRNVVRQALSVLEQDGAIRRIRGRGTFVSAPKIELRVGGLSRQLVQPRLGHQLVALEVRQERVSVRVASLLAIRSGSQIVRAMSVLRVFDEPVALFDSFFPIARVGPLRQRVHDHVPFELVPGSLGSGGHLTETSVAIETSFCSQWEADQLQIPVRAAVFVTQCTESASEAGSMTPHEVVRAVYRVDRVQLGFAVVG
jgi:GntR family transcriptional regulator